MELIRLPGLSEDKYINCTRCGLCLVVCPTYREYLSEINSPRGRVALARKGLEKELKLSKNLFDQMYACFDCLACTQVCPVGIHPADLVVEMRQVQERLRPAAWKKIILGEFLSSPERVELASWPLRIYRQMGKLAASQPGDLAAMLPPLPSRPARQQIPEVTPANGEGRFKVGYFLGCAQNLIFAEESTAAVRVLSVNHCSVITPQETVCCGMPAYGYGRQDLLKEHARINITLFEKTGVDVIVTDCATCGSTLKQYGELFADAPDWAERAAVFSSKVLDISEFLLTIPLTPPRHPVQARVTYHDPCHLRRGQGVWEQPRLLLQKVKGLEFVELHESDWCCGSAGSQLITHYQTSRKVMNRKMDNVESTEVDIIASGCPGCQMQLNVGVHQRDLDIRVTHPIKLLDQAYGVRKESSWKKELSST
jgi:glycolate oxidase iron-sulfur subunit